MRRKLLSVFTALTITVGGGTLATASPAHASGTFGLLCNLSSNGWLFASYDSYGGVGYLRTLHAGRGFRYHLSSIRDVHGRIWIFGHGAEADTTDGWILESHVHCPG
ncbi:hypothetical protein AB0H63_06955 [Micromonospora echinospora]|uniref:hypothetical protein n=1 Tax=Micromonospora echinospora TaxID=1877 RepID=UPI003403AB37